jgi:predicted transcriptional regulator
MIDFACKKFQLKDVIKCGLGISKSDFLIMDFLIKNKKTFNSNEVAEKIGLDLSTVQRSLKSLNEKKIVIRGQNNLSGGGYVYIYRINDKVIIRNKIMDIIKEWAKKVEYELDRW